jgi:ribosomal protein L10
MNREQKASVVQDLHRDFMNNEAAFVVLYQGIPVAGLSKFRRSVRAMCGSVAVAK